MKAKLEELREIVANVLERDPHEIADEADFRQAYEADSMRAIEILSRIEKKYGIEIPQAELAQMATLLAVHEVVARYAGWPQ